MTVEPEWRRCVQVTVHPDGCFKKKRKKWFISQRAVGRRRSPEFGPVIPPLVLFRRTTLSLP